MVANIPDCCWRRFFSSNIRPTTPDDFAVAVCLVSVTSLLLLLLTCSNVTTSISSAELDSSAALWIWTETANQEHSKQEDVWPPPADTSPHQPTDLQWWREARATGAKPPKCRLAHTVKHAWRWTVRNFQILIILQSKSVNKVCKLHQLLGEFVPQASSRGFAPGLTGGSPPDPIGYSPHKWKFLVPPTTEYLILSTIWRLHSSIHLSFTSFLLIVLIVPKYIVFLTCVLLRFSIMCVVKLFNTYPIVFFMLAACTLVQYCTTY